jgi:hypothetical protein
MVQNFVVFCLGPSDKFNELVLGTRERDAQKWISKYLLIYIHMAVLITKPEIFEQRRCRTFFPELFAIKKIALPI